MTMDFKTITATKAVLINVGNYENVRIEISVADRTYDKNHLKVLAQLRDDVDTALANEVVNLGKDPKKFGLI